MKTVAALAFCLAACVAVVPPSAFPIEYSFKDSPEDAKIYVTYRNETKKYICLYPTNWPNAQGEIDTGKGRVFIEISGNRFTTEDFDIGYCPGCTISVSPNHELIGYFKYSDFNLPKSSYEMKKTLIFSPKANYCSLPR